MPRFSPFDSNSSYTSSLDESGINTIDLIVLLHGIDPFRKFLLPNDLVLINFKALVWQNTGERKDMYHIADKVSILLYKLRFQLRETEEFGSARIVSNVIFLCLS